MSDQVMEKEPTQAWITTFAGTAVNLCLGILYAWSVWSASIVFDITVKKGDLVTSTKVIKAADVAKEKPNLKEGEYVEVQPAGTEKRAKLLVKIGTSPKEGYILFSNLLKEGKKLQEGDVATKAGELMTGMNEGWIYLNNAEAATPFSLCVIIFAIFMIPGGRIQDKVSPRFGAITGGLALAAGCIISGISKSYMGLIIGFGVFGGIGMGIGYAAPTPAALKWFGPHRRGLISGLVVGGYGGAALYVSPLGDFLLKNYGISSSFIYLGILFAVVVVIAGTQLKIPPPGYKPPLPKTAPTAKQAAATTKHDWSAGEMMGTWQFFALVLMFIISTQSGLLIIANAAGLLKTAASNIPFLAANAWILSSYGGLVNASGRVGTGFYSDKIGRVNAYTLNCAVSALCLFLLPMVISSKNIFLLFVVVGIAYWQYGGGLSLMPAFTGDFYGAKNLGFNYGLVFMGWGIGFFMARLGGWIKDVTGSLDYAFYISGVLLIVGVIVSRVTQRPKYGTGEAQPAA